MHVQLHKLATTTPRIRKLLQTSDASAKDLAKKYGITINTVYKWRNREDVHDLPHTPHTLHISLSEIQQQIVTELRERVGLSIDDITEVMNRCTAPKLSSSAIQRYLHRTGVTRKKMHPEDDEHVTKPFQRVDEMGFIHMDVKYLTRLDKKRSYAYVAIDRATRFVYLEVLYDLKTETAADFIKRFTQAFGHPVTTILTDNGFEWTDRFSGGTYRPSGGHPVDVACTERGIRHKLTRPRTPQTNGMVERFNRRINEAISAKIKTSNNCGRNSFESHQERNDYIKQFVYNYNRTRLRCLKYRAPIEMVRELSKKNHNQAGEYTCAGMTAWGCGNDGMWVWG